MDMMDNTAMDPMVDGTTMARGLLMLSLRLKLMLIPSMDMDTPLVSMDTLTMAMVETMDLASDDTGDGKTTILVYLATKDGLYHFVFLKSPLLTSVSPEFP